jgi:hypothetical protein
MIEYQLTNSICSRSTGLPLHYPLLRLLEKLRPRMRRKSCLLSGVLHPCDTLISEMEVFAGIVAAVHTLLHKCYLSLQSTARAVSQVCNCRLPMLSHTVADIVSGDLDLLGTCLCCACACAQSSTPLGLMLTCALLLCL